VGAKALKLMNTISVTVQSTVGAGLPAIAVQQATYLSGLMALSLASQLPQDSLCS
jgi:hypothetical protein